MRAKETPEKENKMEALLPKKLLSSPLQFFCLRNKWIKKKRKSPFEIFSFVFWVSVSEKESHKFDLILNLILPWRLIWTIPPLVLEKPAFHPPETKRKQPLPNPPPRKSEISLECQVLNPFFFFFLFKISMFSLVLWVWFYVFIFLKWVFRSRCGGDSAVAEDPFGDEPVHMRNLQQGVPEGPESAAPPARAQPAMEAEAALEQGGQETGLRLPWALLRPPRAVACSRRSHWN